MTCFVGPWYITWLNDPALYFSQSQYLLLCRECRGCTWSGSNWPRSSRQSFITIIHIADPSPNPQSALLKRFTRRPRKNHPKRGSQGSLAGMLGRRKKLRTQQSLVSICAMLCWDPWPCLGHVRIVNQSGAGWNNIGVGRNHKEGNHVIPWQNISLCFYWDLGTSWQAGGNSSWTRAVRTSRGLDCSQEGDRFVGSVVVSTSNRHRKNVLSRIEQLNIAGRAMKVQWKFNGSLRTFSTFLCGNTCFMIR